MSSHRAMARPRTATLVLATLAFAAGAAAIAFTWQPGLATFHDDSASYLVMAQALSPWNAAAGPVLAQMPYEKYPPAFALLLALTGAAFEWHWAHALVAASFGLSVGLLGVLAARISGSFAVGAAAAAIYAVMPGAWLNMKGILSEFPYMALTFGTLAWLAARSTGVLGARGIALLALLLAAVMLTRTIGIALWLAVAAAEAVRYLRLRDLARARSFATALAVALAATGLWYVLRPAVGDDAYVSYSGAVVERTRQEGAAWLAKLVAGNAGAVFDAWLNALVIYWGEAWHPRFIGATLLGALALAAVAWRASRWEVDGLYVAVFLAVLVAWPFPGQMYRLALPVFPLAAALLVCGVAALARRHVPEERAIRIACYSIALPLAFCGPALFYIAERARLPDHSIMEIYRIPFRPDAEASAARQAAAFQDMERIRAATPTDARVMWYGPTYIALLAGRTGVALDYPANAEDLAAQRRRGRPDYVYLSRVHPRDSAWRQGDPFAPAQYLARHADVVWWRHDAAGVPEAALFKVRGEARR